MSYIKISEAYAALEDYYYAIQRLHSQLEVSESLKKTLNLQFRNFIDKHREEYSFYYETREFGIDLLRDACFKNRNLTLRMENHANSLFYLYKKKSFRENGVKTNKNNILNRQLFSLESLIQFNDDGDYINLAANCGAKISFFNYYYHPIKDGEINVRLANNEQHSFMMDQYYKTGVMQRYDRLDRILITFDCGVAFKVPHNHKKEGDDWMGFISHQQDNNTIPVITHNGLKKINHFSNNLFSCKGNYIYFDEDRPLVINDEFGLSSFNNHPKNIPPLILESLEESIRLCEAQIYPDK